MIQNEETKLNNEYFEYMYHLVSNNHNRKNKISYKKLLHYLHSVVFVPMMDMDDNRRLDGIDFRYRFAFENGYSDEYVDKYLGYRECSILEMMIALAFRVEEQITDNYIYGNRTGQWFWSMIISLGLNKMTDQNFDPAYCERVIDRFLERDYAPNGKGGLFTISEPIRDMRDVDIWCQFMWYLNEILEGE